MTETSASTNNQAQNWLLYAGVLILLVAIIVGGYVIFRFFATRVMPDLTAYNLLALSIIAGVASFFSPCAFPLLPGYFSLYYSGVQQNKQTLSSKPSTLKLGLAAAAGVVSFNLILGAIIGILGAGVAQGLSITGENATFIRFFSRWSRGCSLDIGNCPTVRSQSQAYHCRCFGLAHSPTLRC
ncbi:MAG: hypothetical protein Q9P01_18975 [Anaerolineae bacterium]|nr:hypothetical protein [Anaerolineae bacterium]